MDNVDIPLFDTNQRITRNIMDTAMGRVTTSLFPLEDFKHALEIGRMVYKLFPLFDDYMIHHPLVESVLTNEAIIIMYLLNLRIFSIYIGWDHLLFH